MAIGQPVLGHLRSFAATVLYSDQEVGVTRLEVDEKRAVCMQRIGLHQQAIEINAIQQLAQGRDLAAGIGGVGVLGNHNAQRVGVQAHLGDKTLRARSGLLYRTPAGSYRRKPGSRLANPPAQTAIGQRLEKADRIRCIGWVLER